MKRRMKISAASVSAVRRVGRGIISERAVHTSSRGVCGCGSFATRSRTRDRTSSSIISIAKRSISSFVVK
jgi:hypothetical protein